ncbi:hemagglutinin, partial [Mycoplasmopsis synoviae]
LQQIKGDTEAVYFAVTAIASNNWLNTFLIRIPLTKFVRPISVFTAPVVTPPAAETTETQEAQGDSASQSSPQTMLNSSQ